MSVKSLLQRCYPESRFGGFSDVDGTVLFYSRVHALLRPNDRVLDIGCGRGEHAADPVMYRRALRSLRGEGRRVIGIDVSPVGQNNSLIDEFRHITDTRHWPIDDASIDVCVADFVLEHVASPAEFYAEVMRVLKPGGCFCARTTNRWGYVGIISRMIPNRMHGSVVKYAQKGRSEEDVFPTYYRCNSLFRLKKQLRQAGLNAAVMGHETEPMYFSFSSLLFFLGVAYQRLAPQVFRNGLVVFATKPALSERRPEPLLKGPAFSRTREKRAELPVEPTDE